MPPDDPKPTSVAFSLTSHKIPMTTFCRICDKRLSWAFRVFDRRHFQWSFASGTHQQWPVAVRDGDTVRLLADLPLATRQRIRGLIQVRDAVRGCLRTQIDGSGDEAVVAAREQLNQVYDLYMWRFGPISMRANTTAFRGDPDLPLLLSPGAFRRRNEEGEEGSYLPRAHNSVSAPGRYRRLRERGPAHHLERTRPN